MNAPFDWMEPKRNPEAAKAQRGRREAMYRSELEERAALLQRLGRSRDEARARLRANMAWDFERGGSPLGPAQVDAIVDKVFGSANGGGRSAPRASGSKGGTR
jgi:hypothetical protein